MKISVITVVYNNCSTLADTIASVNAQDYTDLEHLVIDGGSTDGTVEVIEAHADKISYWVSEPDKGIYDAMNKGLRAANGEVIVMLNADDVYAHNQVLTKVMQVFEDETIEGVYGDLVYVKPDNLNQVVRCWYSGNYKSGYFLWGWMPPHPTFFVRKAVYDKYGFFDTQLRSAADYELMLRFIHKQGIKLAYLPEILVKMRTGGLSNASLKNRLQAAREDRKAWKINHLNPFFFTIWLKSFRKIPQFFLRYAIQTPTKADYQSKSF